MAVDSLYSSYTWARDRGFSVGHRVALGIPPVSQQPRPHVSNKGAFWFPCMHRRGVRLYRVIVQLESSPTASSHSVHGMRVERLARRDK